MIGKRSIKTLVFLAWAALAACLPQATRTAAPTGISDGPSEAGAGTEIVKGSGSDALPPPDETANQPGPDGSMPTGTLAPHPLVPVNFLYKAEGHYCRFEGEPYRSMIWGRLHFAQVGGGPADSDVSDIPECTEFCQGKGFVITYQYQGAEASAAITIEDAPNFQFVVDIDDPKQFILSLILVPTVANIDLEAPKPNTGSPIDVSAFQPYMVNGAPAYCPKRIPMMAKPVKQTLSPGAPVEFRTPMPQP